MKTNFIKLNYPWPQIFLSLVIVINFISCNKIDSKSFSPPERNLEKEFFKAPQSTDATVLRIIAKIKEQNKKFHFVDNFVLTEGFAKWEKAIIYNDKLNLNNRENFDETINDTIVFIPIIPDQAAFVKDLLSVIVNGDSINIRLLKSEDYKYYGYGENSNGMPNAKDIAQLFILFEKNVFDKYFFDITDTLLAKKLLGEDVVAENMHIIVENDSNGQANLKAAVSMPGPQYTTLGTVVVMSFLPAQTSISLAGLQYWISYYGGATSTSGGPMWWLINGDDPGAGPGSGGGGNSGSSSPGTNTNTGWQVPPCGMQRINNIYYRFTCLPPVDIKALLTSYAIAINAQSEITFNKSNLQKVEYGLAIVKNTAGLIYAKNETTDNDPNHVTINYFLLTNEILLAEEHDHPDSENQTNPLDRSAPTTGDVLALSKNISKPNYVGFVNCGNVRYAIVIENAAKFQAFKNLYITRESKDQLFKTQQDLTYDNPIHTTNWQLATQNALVSSIGSADINGIGIYVSDNPTKTNFIKLN